MFSKYKIEDLFLASISVSYPEYTFGKDGTIMLAPPEIDCGGLFASSTSGYGYRTILWKNGAEYIDLSNKSAKIDRKINPFTTSHTIINLEPLSNYYKEDGTKKIGKRKALSLGEQYYNAMRKKEEENKKN